MQIGPVFIDMSYLQGLLDRGLFGILGELFILGGFLLFVWVCFFFALSYYQEYRENKFTADWRWVVLAVDIPPLNVQTPKAIEQMFAHLAGAFDKPGIKDKFRGGYKQRWFSFEIISIEGYIQFVIRTEAAFQKLVEAALYAQYPDAEITEVEDYVQGLPDTFPDKTYDMWAADFGLAENDAFPIRSYHDFEHSISKDTVLKDPMGAFLESFSHIGPGEQMWFQIMIEPIDNGWKDKAIKKIKELIGEKEKAKTSPLQKLLDVPIQTVGLLSDQIYGAVERGGAKEEKGDKNELRYLTPGQSKLVEAMEQKISMIGFKTKIRGVYIARKEVFKPERGVPALIGAMNQFNIPTSNSIVPKSGASSNEKKTLFMMAYKKRKLKIGANPFVLNVEELATIWHFPMSHVKTPMVQKVETKQSEPPIGLPIERVDAPIIAEKKKKTESSTDAFGYSSDMHFG